MEKIRILRPRLPKEKFEIGKLKGKYVIRRVRDKAIMCKFQMKDQDFFDVRCWLDFFSGLYG